VLNIIYLSNEGDFGKKGLQLLEEITNLEVKGKFFGTEMTKGDIPDNTDLIISFCYPKLIKKEVFEVARFGCINFHPAPLPEYKGFAVYNFAILNGEKEWGVSAHFIDQKFDTGDIIKVNRFKIGKETAHSLRKKSRDRLLILLKEVANEFALSGKLTSIKQDKNKGKYYSKKMMNENRVITPSDDAITIERKIRAFWCPPYAGAAIKLNNIEYTLINKEILKTIE